MWFSHRAIIHEPFTGTAFKGGAILIHTDDFSPLVRAMSQSICILGGGFGGLYTALALSKLNWEDGQPDIVLVDQRDRFIFAPLLYELVTEELQTWEIAPPYEELLANTGVRFHQSGVESINTQAQQVQLTDGTQLAYDRIVLALGGETPMDMAPGAAEHAIPFRSLEDAYRLKERLRQLEDSIETGSIEKVRVAVIGGGYSGVEIACKIADKLGSQGRVRIVERADKILATSPEFNQKAAQKALSEKKTCGLIMKPPSQKSALTPFRSATKTKSIPFQLTS